MWEIHPVHTLSVLPATDCNFKSALERASNEHIQEAIEAMKSSNGQHKSRILACERELRRRKKNEQSEN